MHLGLIGTPFTHASFFLRVGGRFASQYKYCKVLITPLFNKSRNINTKNTVYRFNNKPELSGAVRHPSTDLHRVETFPCAIKSLIRRNFAQLLQSIRRNGGPDPTICVPGSGDRKIGFKILPY